MRLTWILLLAAPALVGQTLGPAPLQLSLKRAVEVAVAPEDAERYAKDKYPKLTPEMLQHLDDLVAKIEKEKITFDGWARPGASVASAALDVARTTCRRAERLVAKLAASNEIDYLVIRYLNRLSDLLWLMARYTETMAP